MYVNSTSQFSEKMFAGLKFFSHRPAPRAATHVKFSDVVKNSFSKLKENLFAQMIEEALLESGVSSMLEEEFDEIRVSMF